MMLSYISESAKLLFGFAPHELTNMPAHLLRSFIADDDWNSTRSKLRLSVKSKDLQSVGYRIRSKNDQVRVVLNRFTGIVNNAGSLVAIEGELVEGEQYLNQMMESELKAYRDAIDLNTIASITDWKGAILYANKKFSDISKYSPEELMGQNHRIINSGYHPKKFFADMWKTIASGRPWRGEVLNKAKDGSLYWVDTVIMPIISARGRITRYLSLRYLITDRKLEEERHKHYIRAVQEMAFTVSHQFRGPVCTIRGLINLMVNYSEPTQPEIKVLIEYLDKSANSLNELTQQLSVMITKCENILNSNNPDEEYSHEGQHPLKFDTELHISLT